MTSRNTHARLVRIVAVGTHTHLKCPVVHARLPWILETLKQTSLHCRLGSANLLQPAFPGRIYTADICTLHYLSCSSCFCISECINEKERKKRLLYCSVLHCTVMLGYRGARNRKRGWGVRKWRERVETMTSAGQTTVNKKAPIHYIIPITDMVHRPL